MKNAEWCEMQFDRMVRNCDYFKTIENEERISNNYFTINIENYILTFDKEKFTKFSKILKEAWAKAHIFEIEILVHINLSGAMESLLISVMKKRSIAEKLEPFFKVESSAVYCDCSRLVLKNFSEFFKDIEELQFPGFLKEYFENPLTQAKIEMLTAQAVLKNAQAILREMKTIYEEKKKKYEEMKGDDKNVRANGEARKNAATAR